MADAYSSAIDSGPLSRRGRYDLQRTSLWNARRAGGFDSHWRDLADFIKPKRIQLRTSNTRNRGQKENQQILDSTATFALNTLRSGLHSGLTSPAREWFKLTTPDPSLAAHPPVKEWLHIVRQRMFWIFAGTNLYQSLPTLYGDAGLFAIGAMGIFNDTKDLFRSYTFPVGSYCVSVDERGIVSTFAREYERSVRQVVREFCVDPGSTTLHLDRVSTRVRRLWDAGHYEDAVPIVHLIQPNEMYRERPRSSKEFAFSSCHYERDQSENTKDDDRKFLRESGYHENPIIAPRWDVISADSSYGDDCPAMVALGDIRQLQTEQRRKAQLLWKAADPPLRAPYSLRTQKTSTLPGDITFVDAREAQQGGFAPVYETRLEGFQHITADINDQRYLIRRAFFEDLFLMLQLGDQANGDPQKTAREIQERHEEKMMILGPTLERFNDEMAKPLVDRVYAMMDRAGMIPDPPKELEGVTLKVEFISILAQAQKLQEVQALNAMMGSVAPLAQFWPEVLDKVDIDQVVENYQEGYGADPRTIRSTEEAAALTQQRNQQQQAMQAAAAAKDAATAAATAGKAPIAPDSALDRMLTGLGGQGAVQ